MSKQTSPTKICPKCDGAGTVPDRGAAGAGLRLMREATTVSLRRVAADMKISRTYLSDLEKGERNWTEALIAKFKKSVEKLKSK